MKARNSICILLLMMLAVACGGNKDAKKEPKRVTNDELLLKGDSTVYGLACEGCTDSVIVLLPNDGSDPRRYDIIDAFRNHQIMGMPRVGDWIALVVNKEDSLKADLVIDLEELKGTWCYVVMPKLRNHDSMSPKMRDRILKDMPDSIRETFMIPREYGFTLKRQWTAQSVGWVPPKSSLEDESPVTYPMLKFFTEWHIWNGKLVMTSGEFVKDGKKEEMTIGKLENDTCDILYLRDDSLVLGAGEQYRSYYRRTNVEDINKRAREIATEQARKALEGAK